MIISFIRYSLIFGAVHFLNLPVFIINIDAVLSTVVVTSLYCLGEVVVLAFLVLEKFTPR